VQQQQQQQSLALLHPARQLHMQQCEPYLATLQDCLMSLGLTQQHPHWTSTSGLWCDLLVQLPGTDTGAEPAAASGTSSSSSDSSSSSSPVEAGGARSSLCKTGGLTSGGQYVIFQILGPADLSGKDEGFISQPMGTCMHLVLLVHSVPNGELQCVLLLLTVVSHPPAWQTKKATAVLCWCCCRC
jgi:hypothetical protein